MRDVQAQVIGIESSTTRTGKTMYSVNLSNGEKVTTFELGDATKASQSGGQTVTVRIEDKLGNNGNVYKNLRGIAYPGETLPPIVAQPGTPVQIGSAGSSNAGGAIPIEQGGGSGSRGSGGGYGMSPEDKIRVTKLSCIGSACELYAGSGDLETALEAAQTIFSAVMSQHTEAQPPQPVAAPQEAIALAQDAASIAAAAAAAGTPIQLGTAGVQPAAEPAALPWTTS